MTAQHTPAAKPETTALGCHLLPLLSAFFLPPENGFMGMGVGAAMTGLRPIVEGMNMGFLLLAFNQISNNCGMLHYTSGGQFKVGVGVAHEALGTGRERRGGRGRVTHATVARSAASAAVLMRATVLGALV